MVVEENPFFHLSSSDLQMCSQTHRHTHTNAHTHIHVYILSFSKRTGLLSTISGPVGQTVMRVPPPICYKWEAGKHVNRYVQNGSTTSVICQDTMNDEDTVCSPNPVKTKQLHLPLYSYYIILQGKQKSISHASFSLHQLVKTYLTGDVHCGTSGQYCHYRHPFVTWKIAKLVAASLCNRGG